MVGKHNHNNNNKISDRANQLSSERTHNERLKGVWQRGFYGRDWDVSLQHAWMSDRLVVRRGYFVSFVLGRTGGIL